MALLKKGSLLTFNLGSSSLKVSGFKVIGQKKLIRFLDLECRFKKNGYALRVEGKTETLTTLDFDKLCIYLIEKVRSMTDFQLCPVMAIGHRLVHGGVCLSELITASLVERIREFEVLAPLHIPLCLKLIDLAKRCFSSKIRQVAIFDTAFHATIPSYASVYAIPYELTLKYGIKRWGFHGISIAFLTRAYFKYTGKKKKGSKLIVLHLGNGCSATAILNGVSIDTSMGFSPSEGLVMGTRCGDIDYAVLKFLAKKEFQSLDKITSIFDAESGLKGISGKSSDLDLLLRKIRTDSRSRLAVDMFCHRIVKYIGAFIAVLGGLDALLFSGGIGENIPTVRHRICLRLRGLGIRLLPDRNRRVASLQRGEVCEIGSPLSSVGVYVIATDENYFMAEKVLEFIKAEL